MFCGCGRVDQHLISLARWPDLSASLQTHTLGERGRGERGRGEREGREREGREGGERGRGEREGRDVWPRGVYRSESKPKLTHPQPTHQQEVRTVHHQPVALVTCTISWLHSLCSDLLGQLGVCVCVWGGGGGGGIVLRW